MAAYRFAPSRYDDGLRAAIGFASILLLGGCGAADNDPGPGGVTVGEARALDEAAEIIEQRRLPPEALKTPADVSSAPLPPTDH